VTFFIWVDIPFDAGGIPDLPAFDLQHELGSNRDNAGDRMQPRLIRSQQ
jgi:hypothetical protein